jgi:signal transduction histidine kinase
MDGSDARESGRTLGRFEGLTRLRLSARWQTLRQTALTVAAIAGFVSGVAATSAALAGYADAGVVFDATGHSVLSVSPTGFAWREGIRPGQGIVQFTMAIAPGGWRLETADGGRAIVSTEGQADGALQDSLPLGLAGLLSGALAVLFRNTHRQWVAPAACLALLASSVPISLQGSTDLFVLVLAGGTLAPAAWFVRRLPIRTPAKAIVFAGCAALVAAWTASLYGRFESFDLFEGGRASIATATTLFVLGDRIVVPIVTRDSIVMHRPRLVDTVTVALLSGVALALVSFLAISPIAVGVLILLILVALPRFRRWLSPRIKVALFADVRVQAAIDAAEEERARIARELHDVPLQHLSGIIRRLELRPDAQRESDELRIVASQLRTVATDLRPPVLDDLGLPAALAFLAEESSSKEVNVGTNIADTTGLDAASRPPSNVELAAFRIAQEAVGNALQHSGAHTVRIRGRIDPDTVDLSVVDDGVGLPADVARSAGRRGRLGLASMRRRAQAIDAELSVDGGPNGTTVRVVWRR